MSRARENLRLGELESNETELRRSFANTAAPIRSLSRDFGTEGGDRQ